MRPFDNQNNPKYEHGNNHEWNHYTCTFAFFLSFINLKITTDVLLLMFLILSSHRLHFTVYYNQFYQAKILVQWLGCLAICRDRSVHGSTAQSLIFINCAIVILSFRVLIVLHLQVPSHNSLHHKLSRQQVLKMKLLLIVISFVDAK